MTDSAISIRGLRKRYGRFLLRDIDLEVPTGFVTGLVGPNGAGKTTIIKLVMNLVRRDAGSIRVFGLDSLADEVAVKRRIGFVYDEAPFYLDVSLRDSARAIAPFYPAWDQARFEALAVRFGLRLAARFKTLSHGMKMKFALAVALAHDADLLIMDEPTAGLDLGFRRELLGELSAILSDERKTVLFSTHITADLERIADYVTLIHDGAVSFTLPKDDLRERWGVVRGEGAALDRLPLAIVRGRRARAHGAEALVDDVRAAREALGPRAIIDRATIDELVLFSASGVHHVDAA